MTIITAPLVTWVDAYSSTSVETMFTPGSSIDVLVLNVELLLIQLVRT